MSRAEVRFEEGFLETYLQMFAKAAEEWGHPSVEQVVLERGRPWIAQRRPLEFSRKMAYRACFKNASDLVIWYDRFDYVEGYAVGRSGIPVLHAWVVDRDGRVIDQTWKQADVEQGQYYGVAFNRDWYLTHIAQTQMYGVFGGNYSDIGRFVHEGLPSEALDARWY